MAAVYVLALVQNVRQWRATIYAHTAVDTAGKIVASSFLKHVATEYSLEGHVICMSIHVFV